MTRTEIIDTIGNLSSDSQNDFYNGLRDNGFTDGEIEYIQKEVFYHKLFSDPNLYNTLCKSMCEEIYHEMREEK